MNVAMDLFHLVKTDEAAALSPRSPPRKKDEIKKKRDKSFVPDLCETSDLSTDSDNGSREEDLSVS